MSDRVLVIVPTYNEAQNLEPILERLHAAVPAAHALVVDDGSPDGTGELAQELASADSRVHVLRRSAKTGLGTAYIAGFRWAREHGYDVVVEMDADGSHAPEQLPDLLAALESADLVLGSRYVLPRGPGGPARPAALRRRRQPGLLLPGRLGLAGGPGRCPRGGGADHLHRTGLRQEQDERLDRWGGIGTGHRLGTEGPARRRAAGPGPPVGARPRRPERDRSP
jgi:glycosyltransferase involved in cell wall biosynthesis